MSLMYADVEICKSKADIFAGNDYLSDTLYSVFPELFQMMWNRNRFEGQDSFRTNVSLLTGHINILFLFIKWRILVSMLTNALGTLDNKGVTVIDLRMRLSGGYMSYNAYQFIGLSSLLMLLKIVHLGKHHAVSQSPIALEGIIKQIFLSCI